jgi:hypothetical protein
MTAPASRIVAVPVTANAPPVLLPLAEIGQSLDYGLDFGAVLADAGGAAISGLSLAVRPTGTLEAAFADLVLQGTSVAAFNVSGTTGARFYTIEMAATLANDDIYVTLARLQVDWSTHPLPVPYPDDGAFGPPLTWVVPPDDGMLTGVGGDQLLGVGGDPIFGVIP